MVYFNNITGDDPAISVKKSVNGNTKSTQKVTVVPVGQKAQDDTAHDVDKLPQGYYIEKTPDDITPAPEPEPTFPPSSEQDDVIDTNINLDQNVSLSESIAIPSDETKPVDDVLENASRRGQNSILNNESITSLDRAESMVKDDPFKPLDQPFKKGFHAAGLARFELNSQRYNIDETSTEIRVNTSAERVDLKATYESPLGNTKLFSYLKGAATNRHTIMEPANVNSETEVQNDDNVVANDKIDMRNKYKAYCAYLGLKQKFNNGQTLSATAFHDHNEAEFSETTAVDAKYDLGIANIEGSTVIYKIGNANSVKTNLSCKFNAFDDNTSNQETAPSEEENNVKNDVKPAEPVQSNNKFERKNGLIIEFESEGDSEQGLGYHWDFRKLTQNTRQRYGFFVKGSTTQRKEESSSYHFTTGANLKCNRAITPKTHFSADLDIKDKLTFGGTDRGNIFTAFGHARIVSPKLAAELEGSAVYTNDGRRNAIVLRGAYKPSKRAVIFGEGGYLYERQPGMTTQSATLRAGVSVKLK